MAAAGSFAGKAELASLEVFQNRVGAAMVKFALYTYNSTTFTKARERALVEAVMRDVTAYQDRMARLVAYGDSPTIGQVANAAAELTITDEQITAEVEPLFWLFL